MAHSRESARASAAFAEYAALGPGRTLKRLAEQWMVGTKSLIARQRQLERWSATYRWQDRVRAYDLERAETKRIKREQLQEEINEKQLEITRDQLGRLLEHIDLLILKGELQGRDAVNYVKILTDLQRVAAGVPNSMVQQEMAGQVVIKNDQRIFAQAIIQDATASQLAVELLDRLADRPNDAGGIRVVGESREVAPRKALEPPQSETP